MGGHGQSPIEVKLDDPAAIRDRARALTSALGDVEVTAGEVRSTWRGIAGHYEAPESGQVLRAMAKPDDVAGELRSKGDRARRALDGYADALEELRSRRDDLIAEAASIRQGRADIESGKVKEPEYVSLKYQHGNGERQESPKAELRGREDALAEDIAELQSDKDRAEIICANAIGAIWGAMPYKLSGETSVSYDLQYGATADAYEQLAYSHESPWGRPAYWSDDGIWLWRGVQGAASSVTSTVGMVGDLSGFRGQGRADAMYSGLWRTGTDLWTVGSPLGMAVHDPTDRAESAARVAEMGKGLVSLDTFGTETAYTIGSFGPDAAVAVATGGTGLAARGAVRTMAASRYAQLAKAAKVDLSGIGAAARKWAASPAGRAMSDFSDLGTWARDQLDGAKEAASRVGQRWQPAAAPAGGPSPSSVAPSRGLDSPGVTQQSVDTSRGSSASPLTSPGGSPSHVPGGGSSPSGTGSPSGGAPEGRWSPGAGSDGPDAPGPVARDGADVGDVRTGGDGRPGEGPAGRDVDGPDGARDRADSEDAGRPRDGSPASSPDGSSPDGSREGPGRDGGPSSDADRSRAPERSPDRAGRDEGGSSPDAGASVSRVGDEGYPFSADDAARMTDSPQARVDLGDGSNGARLVDEPKVYGQPNHPDPVPPAPPEVLQDPWVQEALNGQPPKLVLDEDGVLRTADKQVVTFRYTNPKHELLEMLRQTRLQEDGLNRMSAKDLLENLRSYDANKSQARSARDDYHKTARPVDEPWFGKGQALHSPDMIAGGDARSFDGYGHGGVNHSLGAQWRGEARPLRTALAQEMQDIPEPLWQWVAPKIEVRTMDMLGG